MSEQPPEDLGKPPVLMLVAVVLAHHRNRLGRSGVQALSLDATVRRT